MPRPAKKAVKAAYHHGNLREELILLGLDILEKEGSSALTMREVARRLGVTQTAPLHHFPTKTALLAAIAASGFRQLFERRVAALKGWLEPVDRLMVVMTAYIEFALEHPSLYQLMHGSEIPDKAQYPELNEAAIRSYSLLESAVADYLMAREGSVDRSREATLAAWTACQGLATALTNSQNTPRYVLRKDPMGISKTIFEMLIRGIAKPV